MKETITYKDLELKLALRENIEEIKKAYLYAEKEHEGQKRLTGDDLITHILEVTNILLDLNVDDPTIIAALLHETINHGTTTYEKLKENFGEEVAKIVQSVSKINKLELTKDNETDAIYLRKILVGLAEDVRVLFIKLADRLHNMRTNWAIKPENQKKKAEETLKVLVPIAHRLGINSIKSELENLSLYYLKPDVFNDISEKLNNTVDDLSGYLEEMKESLIEILSLAGIKFTIKGRVKSVYSIYNKLNNGKKWDNIYDILALRVFVDTISDCYAAIGLIHSKFRPMPKRFKDYIASPKENMYQSLHTTVFGPGKKVYEIQVRTYEMDEIAEKGIASHWSYKEKGAKKAQESMEQKLEMFRNVIETNAEDSELETAAENDFLADLIYVYTPKGDVVELPIGSTPIDFAYRIHSHVGDTTVGAIVNDSIVPLNYELQNDDIVSIKTSNTSTPNKDWLNIVKTTQAKNKIKAYFSKQTKEEYTVKGKEIIEQELRKRKLSFNEVLSNKNIEKILSELKLENLEELYLAVGSLRYTAGYIINLTKESSDEASDVLLKKMTPTPEINHQKDILVNGTDDILVSIAKCCKPIKGDEILGFITKGQGISIHKKDCPNIQDKNERTIEVTWNNDTTNYYFTTIYIETSNTNNQMAEIITEIGKKDIQVKSCNIIEKNDRYTYEINIRVKDKEELNMICNVLERMKNTTEVTTYLKG